MTTYPAVDVVVKLHGHDGRTRLVWDEAPVAGVGPEVRA